MFRFLSRVVVVSVFAFSLNFATVPAAQARPSEGGRTVANASSNWVEQAVEWLNRILGKQEKRSQDSKKLVANDGGSCIDPWGNPKPCP
jgi:hypothetical protein